MVDQCNDRSNGLWARYFYNLQWSIRWRLQYCAYELSIYQIRILRETSSGKTIVPQSTWTTRPWFIHYYGENGIWARIVPSVLFANICVFIYTRWNTTPLESRRKQIESIVKLDYVLTPVLWVTSNGQTLKSTETYKVRLKYASWQDSDSDCKCTCDPTCMYILA